jgi:hypothetical protein
VNDEKDLNKVEKQGHESETEKNDNQAAEGEFKLTVRKLEMPVRPRGVLAE